jgi:hypothetical protein
MGARMISDGPQMKRSMSRSYHFLSFTHFVFCLHFPFPFAWLDGWMVGWVNRNLRAFFFFLKATFESSARDVNMNKNKPCVV